MVEGLKPMKYVDQVVFNMPKHDVDKFCNIT